MKEKKIGLIIPACSDLNRGDQALVIETMNVMKKALGIEDVYMMSNNEVNQCERFSLKPFQSILKHPSRHTKNTSNLKYSKALKIKWGIIAIGDLVFSAMLLNSFLRKLVSMFASSETKKSIELFEKAEAIFVKGGGFMHDYTGGLIGRYTMYYQLFHIKLAIKMKKNVYIMPNSFGPFKNKRNSKVLNKLLDKCTFVSARESISANGQTNGLNRNIKLYPDLGFFLEQEDSNETKEYLKKYQIDFEKNKYIAITARPYRFYEAENKEEKYEEYQESFVKIIEYINTLGYIPLLVVHTRAQNNHENDEICIQEIVKKIGSKDKYIVIKDDNLTCKNLKSIYSLCSAIIGTRFHSVIFSIENLVPAIAITYGGNKGQGIMKDIGIENYAIKIEELNSNILKEKLDMLLEEEKIVKGKLEQYIKKANEEYEKMIKEIKMLGEK